MTAPRRSVDVLGVPVRPLSWPELRDEVIRRATSDEHPATVMYANVHVVNLAYRSAPLKAALANADLVYCDGEGVRLGAKLLGGSLPARMTGADFIWDLARALAAAQVSLGWLGGTPDVAERALGVLAAAHPTLVTAVGHHGYFARDGAETDAVIEAINAARPQLLLVGMGSPIQELWVARHRARLTARVVWCIGATADFVTGIQPRGPSMLTRNGFEWLARLAHDPRRLLDRYVIGNPLFLARILRARLRRATPREAS